MTELIAQLRADPSNALHQQAADLIATLTERSEAQQTLLDKGASLLTEAILSEDGVDSGQADEFIEAVRDQLGTVGKTTAELMLERLFARIASAAGLPAEAEFDPLFVLSQMQIALSTQKMQGAYLEFTLDRIFWATPDGTMRLRVSKPDAEPHFMTFPAGTNYMTALDTAIRALPKAAESSGQEQVEAAAA